MLCFVQSSKENIGEPLQVLAMATQYRTDSSIKLAKVWARCGMNPKVLIKVKSETRKHSREEQRYGTDRWWAKQLDLQIQKFQSLRQL